MINSIQNLLEKNMDALKLFKFVQENGCEYHWLLDEEGKDNVVLFIAFSEIMLFSHLCKSYIAHKMETGGIPCLLQQYGLAVLMRDICEFYEIEIEEIFERLKLRLC